MKKDMKFQMHYSLCTINKADNVMPLKRDILNAPERWLSGAKQAGGQNHQHLPVIKIPEQVKAGAKFPVRVLIADCIKYLGKPKHYIKWVSLIFQPKDNEPIRTVGHFKSDNYCKTPSERQNELVRHRDEFRVNMKINKSGTLHVLTFCNIHGVCESATEIRAI